MTDRDKARLPELETDLMQEVRMMTSAKNGGLGGIAGEMAVGCGNNGGDGGDGGGGCGGCGS